MSLNHLSQGTVNPVVFAVCAPDGRILHPTMGSNTTEACELFSREYDIPWHQATVEGYEVMELVRRVGSLH